MKYSIEWITHDLSVYSEKLKDLSNEKDKEKVITGLRLIIKFLYFSLKHLKGIK